LLHAAAATANPVNAASQLYNDPTSEVANWLPNTYLPPPGSRSSGESAKPDSLPLFSLLLSGLKFQAGVVGKTPQQPQQPSGPIELLVYCADALALLLAMSDLNEEPGGNTSVRHRWLVLAGRLMISTGQALQVSRMTSC
jgi:hypothetical protein